MKLLYLFTFDYSLKVWNKAGILERELAYFSELKKNNIDIKIVTYGDASDEKLLNNIDLEIYPIYKFTSRSKYKLFRILKSLLFPWIIKKNVEFDIIKQNQLQGSWVAMLLKIISRKKLIIRTGYDVFLFSIKENKAFLKKVLIYLLTQLALLVADLYTISSNDDKDFLEKKFIVKNYKLNIRRNWVFVDLSVASFSSRISESILSVGRLEKQKNFLKLIDFAENTYHKLIIFGTGSEYEKISEYAKYKKVPLKINEPVENKELVEIMKNYIFFITTTLFEGNPKTILEAMGAGCVVVAPNSKNNTEIIENNHNGYLFDLKNENPFNIIKNKDIKELKNISMNAIDTVKNNYSFEKFIADELLELKKIYD